MSLKTYVSYLRVSTARQGASGLGLEAQREAVRRYATGRKGSIVAELVEVESGRRSDRPQLAKAIAAARLRGATLLVSKVDRLTRSVNFLSQLLTSGVEVAFADLPSVEGPTGKFMLNQMVAVAELERDLIASRTRDALAAAKARGVALGGDRGGRAPAGAGAKG
jgi:DNA invertase Pin-like site-specific DNA recombinase